MERSLREFGEWDALAIASCMEASYTPDGSTWVSSYQNQQTVLRAVLWADGKVRGAASFVIQPGITP